MNKLIAGGITGALALLVGGTAGAVLPDADGTFHGCVNQATGNLRVVDPDKPGNLGSCITSGHPFLREQPVEWAQAGPPGPAGPGSVIHERFGGGVNVDEQPYHLAMDLPAGAYEVTLTFQIDNDSNDPAVRPVLTCQLGAEGGPARQLRQSVAPVRGVELVSGVYTFEETEPWQLALDCPQTPGFLLHMSDVALRARAVEAIHPG